jgi:hypothetical protein
VPEEVVDTEGETITLDGQVTATYGQTVDKPSELNPSEDNREYSSYRSNSTKYSMLDSE